jgi:hypothetical protein
MRLPTAPAAALLLAAAAPAAQAQGVVVDVGSFTITANDQPVGREDFRITRTESSAGRSYVANATVTYSDRKLYPALSTDAAGLPANYQVEVRVGQDTREKLYGQLGEGKFSARVQTPRGESAKEYIVADGALILDDDVFHQYFFVAQREPGPAAVVVPRRNVQVRMTLRAGAPQTVTIGGSAIEARHLVLTEPGGAAREIWVDAQGRVLKVALPARGVVALRDDPPR